MLCGTPASAKGMQACISLGFEIFVFAQAQHRGLDSSSCHQTPEWLDGGILMQQTERRTCSGGFFRKRPEEEGGSRDSLCKLGSSSF